MHLADAAGVAQPLVAADGRHADALGHGIQLVQALGRDDLEPFALEILRADTAGVAQHLNAREVFLSEAGHAADALHKCRHHLDILDAVLFDEPHDRLGVELGRHDERVAAVEAVEGRRVRRAVKQRAREQLAHLKAHTGHGEPGPQTLVALPCRHVLLDDLRLPRRASGAVGKIGDGEHIGGHVRGAVGTQCSEFRRAQAGIAVRLFAVRDDERRRHTRADLHQIALRRAVGHRHVAGAGLPDAERERDVRRDVRQRGEHALTRADALTKQVPGNAVRELVELPPRHDGLLVFRGNVNDRRRIRLHGGDVRQLCAGCEEALRPGIENVKMLRAHLHHFLTALNLAYADPARPQQAGSATLENYFGRLFGR